MFNKFVLFPHNLGQLKNGVQNTPKIMKQFLNKDNSYYEVIDTNNMFYNLNKLYKINNSITGKRINIGGDHSMSIATVAHTSNKYFNSKVIWVDAHADINTYNSSKTKNYHGMPLSFLTGMSKNKKINYISNFVPFRNILYFGVRDLDPFEEAVIKNKKIKIITMNDIKEDYNRCIGKVLDFIKDDYVHLSFDVDSLDPLMMPSTGTKVINGLMLDEAKYLNDILLERTMLYNVDITELNLEIGSVSDRVRSLNNTFYIFKNYFE